MLLENSVQKFEVSGTQKPKHFSAKVGGKFFSVMFDKLYSNKIAAVIRELSTNAYEIHQVCNKETTPFHVKLPSWLDTNFSIRDFGTGLTEYEIEKIYTCAFESTKDDSNVLGGAFGLGSKTPFAYVDNFIVNSYVNGTKYSYFFIKDKEGCPSYSLADKSKTLEPNGLEITIAVNKNDINEFCRTAQSVYKWFKNKPKVYGNTNYVEPKKEKPLLEGDGWEYYQGSSNHPTAIMGNISYTLSNFPQGNSFLINGMVLYFDIGEISPAPNRETLSYDKTTIDNINKRLKEISDVIQKNIESKIQKCPNFWQASIEAKNINNIFNIQTVNYKGKNVLSRIDFPKGKILHTIVNRRTSKNDHSYVTPCHYHQIPRFFVDDLSRGGITRIKALRESRECWYCTAADVKEFKEILLLEDNQIEYVSTLPKVEYAKRVSGNSHKTKVMKLTNNYHYATNCWTDCEVDLKDGEGYFVEVNSNKIKYNGREVHPSYVYSLAVDMKIEIYGVKTAYLNKINTDNWENGIEKIYKDGLVLFNNNKSIFDDKATLTSYEKNYGYFNTNLKMLNTSLLKRNPSNELSKFYSTIEKIRKKCDANKNLFESLSKINRFLIEIGQGVAYNGVALPSIEKETAILVKKYILLNNYCSDIDELVYYCLYLDKYGR